jgi:probable H4MPT-linked C1 transfer pathway protein
MSAIGLDIGGANIKISDGWRTLSHPFALWKSPQTLPDALGVLLSEFDSQCPLAVTMTGELADCFATKAEGVCAILDAVSLAAGARPLAIWQSGGEFVSIEDARELVPLVAAANWHALATWAGRMRPDGRSLLVDVGSTTTDIIPLEDGVPVPWGRTDPERLGTGELVYVGVRRTPLCALADQVEFRGRMTGIAREFFATTADLHVVLGHFPEDADRHDTADGRPETVSAASNRVARMLCLDGSELTREETAKICHHFYEQELRLIVQGIRQVQGAQQGSVSGLLLCGEGEFLARQACVEAGIVSPECETVLLSAAMSRADSQGACAFALARLGSERL